MIPSCAAVRQVILDQVGKLVVHELDLGLVDADHERCQADAGLAVPPLQPEHAAAHQVEQLLAG